MVYLWLASSQQSYRSHETERLPFRSKPRKLIYRMDAVSDRVAELCKANNVPTTSNCAHFVGVARANRKFQYDDFKILSVGEREQYRHWIALSSDCAASLWFFDIIDIHRTRTNAKLNEYCNTRSLYQFQYASPESADHLLARMSDECDGDLPEWLENRPGAIRLVVVLPPALLHWSLPVSGKVLQFLRRTHVVFSRVRGGSVTQSILLSKYCSTARFRT